MTLFILAFCFITTSIHLLLTPPPIKLKGRKINSSTSLVQKLTRLFSHIHIPPHSIMAMATTMPMPTPPPKSTESATEPSYYFKMSG